MAIYYVRTDGSDSNTGLGATSGQAWQTVSKALGASGISSGDTLYIAPGDYRQTATITVGGTYTVPTFINGNPTASQFSGITPGRVLITNRLSNDIGSPSGTFNIFTLASKNYLRFDSLEFEQCANSNIFSTTDCIELRWTKCCFGMSANDQTCILSTDTPSLGLTKNYYITQCITSGFGNGNLYNDSTIGRSTPSNWVYNLYIDRVVCLGASVVALFNGSNLTYSGTGIYISNCFGIGFSTNNIKSDIYIRNCVSSTQPFWVAGGVGTNSLVDSCSVRSLLGFTGFTLTNVYTGKYYPVNTGIRRLWGIEQREWFTNTGLYSYATGTTTNAPVSDFYGNTWDGVTPNIGSYNSYSTTIPGQYNPTERNASAITIAPGSTSQSIELYLGATGLTFSTSGLAAYYVRNQSAPVAITLVTQTPTGAWTSGGFAEISSSLVPGVYRLDVPNAAFAAGASDVTIVVRGASGTNGAVLTVTLSSGGLTAAQTAAAVFDAVASSYTTAGSMGARLLKTTVDNRPADVGASHHIHANVHAIVDSTAAASELSGALLHNGTDYIDSNLISGNSTRVFVGRFDLRQTGSETVDTIEVFTTDTPSFELQLTDGDGNSVPVTGATLGLRILDVASTVVETGTPTVEYGTGGIVRWTGPGTYLAIGCPVGNYRLFIDRTVSGTTTTFGPLQIRVQAQ
jgi:hypothetical protein